MDEISPCIDECFTDTQGCAIAMGYTASSHLDTVLTKLESVAKNEMGKKSGGIFSMLKVRKFYFLIICFNSPFGLFFS